MNSVLLATEPRWRLPRFGQKQAARVSITLREVKKFVLFSTPPESARRTETAWLTCASGKDSKVLVLRPHFFAAAINLLVATQIPSSAPLMDLML
ncbi:hypothetical protein QR680_017140 [Steinernema hermaphroditum]|uniref:Uncharacterized protein n=1 Tax=Steinernema hermaphroditum TaxID=289476 RepID=A0AA39HDG1_9BILA|nr:hypothetical protein QR680_017140 [Steinernema hermaphroditum]